MNNFDITTLENAFIGIVKQGGVTSTVYPNRPKSTVPENDFVVVKVADGVTDMDTYGECTLGIDLFARDVANIKNGAKLSYMYRKLCECLPRSLDVTKNGTIVASYIPDPNPQIFMDTPDDYGFHARLVNVKITIKVI